MKLQILQCRISSCFYIAQFIICLISMKKGVIGVGERFQVSSPADVGNVQTVVWCCPTMGLTKRHPGVTGHSYVCACLLQSRTASCTGGSTAGTYRLASLWYLFKCRSENVKYAVLSRKVTFSEKQGRGKKKLK